MMTAESTIHPRILTCKAYHAANTCDRLDPLAKGTVSLLALIHNETHGHDKVLPENMGVYPKKTREGKS